MIVFEPLQPAPRLPVGTGHALQPGDMLEDFEITQVMGLTSFGVIYLAQDRAQRPVAIKEFLPVAIAARSGEGRIDLRDSTHEEAFERGRQSFINEALTLSQFDHPNLLRISSVWEANGTAYRAMPHYGGSSLLARRFASKQPPGEQELRDMLEGLTGALETLHSAGFSHGQVEPMNILVLDDGRALLLDFDAARHAILSDLRVPFIDTYADADHLPQNQAADLHALAAVMHFAISGQWSPLSPPGVSRQHEPLASVVARLKGGTESGYDAEFLKGIDRALALPQEKYPGNVPEFRALFVPERVPEPGESAAAPAESAEPAAVGHADRSLLPAVHSAVDAAAPSGTQPVSEPLAQRIEPRLVPTRMEREYPLNSSESVLELLAAFGRPRAVPEDAEPFQPPALPTLTEEAEPALPPLRENLFDAIDAGNVISKTDVAYGRIAPGRRPPSRWRRAPIWGLVGLLVLAGGVWARYWST